MHPRVGHDLPSLFMGASDQNPGVAVLELIFNSTEEWKKGRSEVRRGMTFTTEPAYCILGVAFGESAERHDEGPFRPSWYDGGA